MSTSLYQKYRPQTFADLVGQSHISTTLLNELQSGHVSHAYLFSGPRGVGKTSSARLLARAINCTAPVKGEPCNSCDHCTAILAGRALDIIEIDAASHTGVDNVRDNIIENARVAPSQLSWKVFIIDEVHMLSTAAFNALLKTLEEPPSRTMFILATTELHKVPETIISRCERFLFHRIGLPDMTARLHKLAVAEERDVEESVLKAIAKRSEGAQRDAESLLGQVLALEEKTITAEIAAIVLPRSDTSSMIALWQEVVSGDIKAALNRVDAMAAEGVFMTDFSREWIELLRLLMMAAVHENMTPLEYVDADEAEMEGLKQSLTQVNPTQISAMIDRFLKADGQLAQAAIQTLPIELALVDVTVPASAPQPAPAAPAPVKQPPVQEPVVEEPAHKITVPPAGEMPEEAMAFVEPAMKPAPQQTAPVDQPVEALAVTPEASPVQGAGERVLVEATHEAVKGMWDELLKEMNSHNHALKFAFQVGKLVGVQDNVITLGFQHQFYKDRIEDARNSDVIHKVLSLFFAGSVRVSAIVGPEYAILGPDVEGDNIEQPNEEDVSNVWDLANAAFGTAREADEA